MVEDMAVKRVPNQGLLANDHPIGWLVGLFKLSVVQGGIKAGPEPQRGSLQTLASLDKDYAIQA